MTDDGSAPTIPDTQAPTHGSSVAGAAPGTPDPRYGLRALLGKGGMGEVWLAHDGRIDREIAIKLMRGTTDPDSVARFLREARVQGRLEHPSVVPVHDLGTEPGTPYFAMKRLTGTTLAEVLRIPDEKKWPRRTLLARFVDVCLAVEFAHERGVIHRDLKPANIMLGDYGEAYVLDWGLARIAGDSGDTGMIRASDLEKGDSHGQTEAGAVLGTPGYMAPEQLRGEPVDARADIFALGCILFEILAGTPAIARDRPFEVTLASPCYRPSQRTQDVPPELDTACAKATAAQRDDRHPSARALADEVQRFLDGDRDLERRRQLSAEHAQRARELASNADIDSRADAIREVGSAIALDTNNRDAQALLMRLLIEPPKELPPEVARAVDDERQTAFLPVMRGMSVIYLLSVVLVFAVKGIDALHEWPLALLVAEMTTASILLTLALWQGWRVTRSLFWLAAVLHTAVITTVGVGLGPFLILPLLMFGSMPVMLLAPAVRGPGMVLVAHSVAFTLPLLLEWLKILPRSFQLVGHALVLDPPVVLTASSIIVAIVALIVLQLVGLSIVLYGQRRERDRAQELVHLRSWQFAQLVRSSGSTP